MLVKELIKILQEECNPDAEVRGYDLDGEDYIQHKWVSDVDIDDTHIDLAITERKPQ